MSNIIPGAKVHYTAPHGEKSNGIVKSITEDAAFVVFHCDNWENYKEYTGQHTKLSDISYGWVDENGRILKEYCDHHYIHTNAKWRPVNERQCIYCLDIQE